MSIADDIKRSCAEKNIATDQVAFEIEKELNKLFYLKPKPKAEGKFITQVLLKNGEALERTGLHASAIIVGDKEFCYREQVLSLFYKMTQGGNIPISLKRIFEEGNAIHEKWQKLFIRGGFGTWEDMDLSRQADDYDMTYSPDAVLHDFMGKDWVVEIKSMNTFAFQHAIDHPSGRHQLELYEHFTKIHNGFVLAEDKNTQKIKVFVHNYDIGEIDQYLERLDNVKAYKARLQLKHKLCKGRCKNAECVRASKCNMRDACFNVGEGRQKLQK